MENETSKNNYDKDIINTIGKWAAIVIGIWTTGFVAGQVCDIFKPVKPASNDTYNYITNNYPEAPKDETKKSSKEE